jgi:hypothetical protein
MKDIKGNTLFLQETWTLSPPVLHTSLTTQVSVRFLGTLGKKDLSLYWSWSLPRGMSMSSIPVPFLCPWCSGPPCSSWSYVSKLSLSACTIWALYKGLAELCEEKRKVCSQIDLSEILTLALLASGGIFLTWFGFLICKMGCYFALLNKVSSEH